MATLLMKFLHMVCVVRAVMQESSIQMMRRELRARGLPGPDATPHLGVDLVKDQSDNHETGIDDNLDYFLLADGEGGCAADVLPGPIYQPAMCRMAAQEINITAAPSSSFEIDLNFYDSHPAGCFVAGCNTSIDPKGLCAYMNPIGAVPSCTNGTTCSGGAICPRKRLLYGAADSAAEDGGCATGYKVLKDQNVCGTATKLLRHCEGDPFETGVHNLSKVMDYPLGCFRDTLDGGNGTHDCLYYNPGNTVLGAPSSVHGTPICIVADVTKIDFGGKHFNGTTAR